MRLILIDDRGELWGQSSPIARRSFAGPSGDEGYTTYLVRNLGFAAIDQFGASLQVRLRPAITSQATFETLMTWLARQTCERVVLNYFDGEWRLELHRSTALLGHRVLELINTLQLARPRDFIARPAPVDSLNDFPVLMSLLRSWPQLRERVHQDGLRRILAQITKDRYTLLRYDPSTRALVIEESGSGYTSYGKDWPKRARGALFEQQPDVDYGHWLRRTYDAALQCEDPLVHDVDAIVSTPEFGRYRLRYKRIILPCHTQAGTWLLASSTLEDSIDLRVDEALQRPA
ncbi:MAG: hypothetical protein ACFCUN_08725 [Hyphomicrobiaceae bacterium]